VTEKPRTQEMLGKRQKTSQGSLAMQGGKEKWGKRKGIREMTPEKSQATREISTVRNPRNLGRARGDKDKEREEKEKCLKSGWQRWVYNRKPSKDRES
jgi:hypothetical protein